MLTVRFPNGTSVEYRQANYLVSTASGLDLFTRKDGDWVARITTGCVVEGQAASRIYNHLRSPEQLRILLQSLREMNYSELSIAVALKRELAKFNSRTRSWKE